MASNKKRVNKRVEHPPKRRIGRYVLVLFLLVPLLVQVRHVDWQALLPEVEVGAEVEISRVHIEGHFKYTSKTALQKNIVALLQEDFVSLDLAVLQGVLLENPWYKSVSVSRVWPSSLRVVVEEQQPIARWGRRGFINSYGDVIFVEQLQALQHLPVLEGADSKAYTIAKDYLTMAKLLSKQQLYITALSVNGEGNWTLEINGDYELELGDQNISNRVERFLFLYAQQLEPMKTRIETVDMRYPNGIAVGWKNGTSKDVEGNNEIASR